MKKVYFLFLILTCFKGIIYGACLPCDCTPSNATPDEEIQVYDWPTEPITIYTCCGETITAEEIGRGIYPPPVGVDHDKFVQEPFYQDNNCNCLPHPEPWISYPGDWVDLIWSGTIDPCTSGPQTITGTFFNPNENLTPQGGGRCIEWDSVDKDVCTSYSCTNLVPYTVVETKTRTLTVNVVPLTCCACACAKNPEDCAAGETYNSATCSCVSEEPPCPIPPCEDQCPYPPCEPPCPNPPCEPPCPNPPCEPPCPTPPCEDPCPVPPCDDPCPTPPCDPGPPPPSPPPCPAGEHFDEDLDQCVPDTTTPTCPPDMHWDPLVNDCVPGPPPINCDPGWHYDPVLGYCVQDPQPDPCPKDNEVWDPYLERCVCADENDQPVSDEPCCGEEDKECGNCPGKGSCSSGGNCAAENGIGPNGLTLTASIGAGANGNSNPVLVMQDYALHSGSASAANLQLTHGSNAEEIRYGPGQAFRQILTGSRLIDIVTLTPTKFEVRQYDYADKGTKDVNGLYQPTGGVLQSMTVENPIVSSLPDYSRLLVTTVEGTDAPVIDEYYISPSTGDWRLGRAFDTATGKFTRVEFRQSSWIVQDSEWMHTYTVTDGNGVVASLVHKKYKLFPWGKEQTEEIVETGLPGHAGYVSTWEYYTDPNQTGKYSELKTHVDQRGGWTRYDYDADGREIKRVLPFKNSPVTALDSEAHVFETSRTTDPNTGIVTELEVEKMLGTVVGRKYRIYDGYTLTSIVCLSPTATQSDPANLVTVTTRYAAGPLRLQEQSVHNSDGTMSFTDFSYSGTDLIVTKTTGEPNSAKTAIIDGTRTVTRTNRGGFVVETQVFDIVTGLQINGSTVAAFDVFGRPTQTNYYDTTSESAVYACCNGADSVTDKTGITTTYTHDKLGRTLTETRHGVTTAYTYDAEGRRLKTTRIGTDATAIVQETNRYDWAGDLTAKRDTYNYITAYSHPNNNPRITHEVGPDGGLIATESNLDGTPKSVSGSASRPSVTDYLVENNSRVARTVSGSTCLTCAGTEWVKTYTDMAGRQFEVVYPDAAQSVMFYNAKGQLWKSVDPDGIAMLFEYDGQGRTAKQVVDMDRDDIIDLAGDDRIAATAYSVTLDNTTVKVSQSLSEWQTASQNTPTVVQTSVKSANTLESWSSKFGLVTHSAVVIGSNGTHTETVTNPDGSKQIQLSSGDRVLEATKLDSANVQIEKTTYAYDPHGRIESTTEARNGVTDYGYYNNDQVQSITLPAADVSTARQQQSFIYDTMNRVKETTLADLSKTYNEYFVTGDVKRTWGSQTYEQAYTYDSQGRRRTLTTAGNRTTTWNYDPERGWLSSKIYDDGKGTAYTYTPGAKLKTRTWARGIVTTYGYNYTGELTLTDYSDSTPDVTYTYNRRGLKDTIADAAGIRDMKYNIAGMYGGETIYGNYTYLDIIAYYDALLRQEMLDFEEFISGFRYITGYEYDNASRINHVLNPTSDDTEFLYEYEPNSSLIKSLTYKKMGATNFMRTTRVHDKLNRVTSLHTKRLSDNHTLAAYNYTYNSLNQRETVQAADNSYWDYDYDPLGQVISGAKKLPGGQQINGYDYGYTFDGIGNRITADVNGKVQQYTANNLNQYEQRTLPGDLDVVGEADPAASVAVNSSPASRQDKFYHGEVAVNNGAAPVYQHVAITTDNVLTDEKDILVPKTPELFTYDWDGNLLTDGKWTYTWDGENRLVDMETTATVPAAAKHKITYQYDYMGRRITKTTHPWNAQTSAWGSGTLREFFYSGWNLIGEIEPQNSIPAGYHVWGLDLSGTPQGAGGVGGLLSTSDGIGTWYLPITDGNGNVMKLIDPWTATVAGEYEYGPFGEVLRATGPAAEDHPFRFSSKYQEPESGLLYYGLRYFDPKLGRWINRDFIEERGGYNLYSNEDFVSYIDVLGMYPYSSNQLTNSVKKFFVKFENHTQRQKGDCVGSGPCQDKCMEFCSDKGGMQSNFIEHTWIKAYKIIVILLPKPKLSGKFKKIPGQHEFRSHLNQSGNPDIICNCTCKDQFKDLNWLFPKVKPYTVLMQKGTEPTAEYTYPHYPFDPGEATEEVPEEDI